LHQALLDLTSPWTVMCVAAHPDDEDGTTLTVLRRKYGVHTVSLFSTYGEGGQNAVGPELYEELGVIRAAETLKAAQIQGSEPYFLGLKDFGFSKSADEAFRVWGHDEALRRMVLKIRELKPDVVITNHDTTTGHGHHQATGRLLLEAFEVAADPQRFPEQVSQTGTWQIKRIFVRGRRQPTETTTAAAPVVVVDPNEVDPLRGASYGEQALRALQQHASQGPWPQSVSDWLRAQNNQTGKLSLIRYQLVRAAKDAPPLPDQPATVVAGLQLPDEIASKINPPLLNGRPLTELLDEPEKVLNALIDWRLTLPSAVMPLEGQRLKLVLSRVSHALAVASGTSLSLHSATPVIVPGSNGKFTVTLVNSGSRTIRVRQLSFVGWDNKAPLEAADPLLPDTETTVSLERLTPPNATMTVPHEDHLYDGLFLGRRFAAEADLEIEGAKFSVTSGLRLDVTPAVEIKSVTPHPYVWTPQTIDQPANLNVLLMNHTLQPFRGRLRVSSPALRIFEFAQDSVLGPEESRSLPLQLVASMDVRQSRRLTREAQATLVVEQSESGARVTERPVHFNYIDAYVTRNLHVGYLPSFDQTLETSLKALGVKATRLTVPEIAAGDLSVYNTIVIDNRGYEAHQDLIPANDRLLKYVEAGGTLIVFYHKDNEWNPDARKGRPQLAPYPIILDDQRVTEENAAVRLLQPRHRLLNYPNKITAADFKSWIQERGLYYPREWDPHYTALFSSNDPDEKPLNGGLLVAPYGKGNYIYTSMVWYRQLRAGVPGGYRMFANMISYGRSGRRH
jgi:LmbE family N-acetylglucosaminyl deacetylase